MDTNEDLEAFERKAWIVGGLVILVWAIVFVWLVSFLPTGG
jgi:hypothetical protein